MTSSRSFGSRSARARSMPPLREYAPATLGAWLSCLKMLKAGRSPLSVYGSRGTGKRYRGDGMNLEPEDLQREIDEVLEELDRREAEVLELVADVGGGDALQKGVAYQRPQE